MCHAIGIIGSMFDLLHESSRIWLYSSEAIMIRFDNVYHILL